MSFVLKKDSSRLIHKYGVDINIFDTKSGIGVVYEEVEKGHFQEWFDDVSTYHWYIIDGKGEFIINNQKEIVEKGDLVVVPPKNRIYYLGNMKMLLITSPKFSPENEHEVRVIEQFEVEK